MLVFITIRRVAAKILTFSCMKMPKHALNNVWMLVFIINRRVAAKILILLCRKMHKHALKWMLVFIIIRDIFMQENALKYGCFIFMQENALKYGCLFSLPFVAWWQKLWHFYAGICIKMNAFIINHRAAAKKNVDNFKNKFQQFHAGKCPKECIKMNQVFYQVFI